MWKFQNISATKILREMNFTDSRSAKIAILTSLETMNFDFHEFLHFLRAEFDQILTAVFETQKCPKNDFT